MSTIPNELKYTEDHEWALIEGDTAKIGITHFAQSSLGDIVFVELPEIGINVEKGKSFSVVESIKSVSDLYAPFDGMVIEVNSKLEDNPELCNVNPYEAWIIKVKMNNKNDFDSLLNSGQYQTHCENSQ